MHSLRGNSWPLSANKWYFYQHIRLSVEILATWPPRPGKSSCSCQNIKWCKNTWKGNSVIELYSSLCHKIIDCPWTNHLPFLFLSFLIHKDYDKCPIHHTSQFEGSIVRIKWALPVTEWFILGRRKHSAWTWGWIEGFLTGWVIKSVAAAAGRPKGRERGNQ